MTLFKKTQKTEKTEKTIVLKTGTIETTSKRVEAFKEFISKKLETCSTLSYRSFVKEFSKTDKAGFLNASKLDINASITKACKLLAIKAINDKLAYFPSAELFNYDYLVITRRNIAEVEKYFPELIKTNTDKKTTKSKTVKTAKEKLLDYISINSDSFDLTAINEAIEALENLKKLKSPAVIRKAKTTKTKTDATAKPVVKLIASKAQTSKKSVKA